jgi:hypothetical protein
MRNWPGLKGKWLLDIYCLWQQPLKASARLLIRSTRRNYQSCYFWIFYLKVRKKSFIELNIQTCTALDHGWVCERQKKGMERWKAAIGSSLWLPLMLCLGVLPTLTNSRIMRALTRAPQREGGWLGGMKVFMKRGFSDHRKNYWVHITKDASWSLLIFPVTTA